MAPCSINTSPGSTAAATPAKTSSTRPTWQPTELSASSASAESAAPSAATTTPSSAPSGFRSSTTWATRHTAGLVESQSASAGSPPLSSTPAPSRNGKSPGSTTGPSAHENPVGRPVPLPPSRNRGMMDPPVRPLWGNRHHDRVGPRCNDAWRAIWKFCQHGDRWATALPGGHDPEPHGLRAGQQPHRGRITGSGRSPGDHHTANLGFSPPWPRQTEGTRRRRRSQPTSRSRGRIAHRWLGNERYDSTIQPDGGVLPTDGHSGHKTARRTGRPDQKSADRPVHHVPCPASPMTGTPRRRETCGAPTD